MHRVVAVGGRRDAGGDVFSNNDVSSAQLSPSGTRVGLIVASKAGRQVLAVVDVGATTLPKVVASDPRADIRRFAWVGDDWLVYDTLDLRSGSSDQEFGPGLFSVRHDGTNARQLVAITPYSSRPTAVAEILRVGYELYAVPRDSGTFVFVKWDEFDAKGELLSRTLKRVDVTTGYASSPFTGYPAGVVSWVFDQRGEPRAVQTQVDGVSEVYWFDAGKWRSLVRAPAMEMPWRPLAVDGQGNLFVTARVADSNWVLKRFDFQAGAPEAAPIVSTPGFDFDGSLIFDHEDSTLVGVRVTTDAETTVWLRDERKRLQALADARFPGAVNRTLCQRCDKDGAMLVWSWSDRSPGRFFVYSPKADTWTGLGSQRSSVDARRMATLDLHRIPARDGLDIPVWITTPRGPFAAPPPAVVVVHEGPWTRGVYWRWNPVEQFLASRGYVVIVPEFRGSAGFGEKLFKAGWKAWGTGMQDDVADAVRWAAAKGLIDGRRVCILGQSYGGYAALMGSIRSPDLYLCAITSMAVTEPRLLLESNWIPTTSEEIRKNTYPVLIGDLVKDADLLKQASPVERARELKAHVLMATGTNDPLRHNASMRAALRLAGNDPEYLVYDGEGRTLLKVENRIDFWTRVEKFLAKHLTDPK